MTALSNGNGHAPAAPLLHLANETEQLVLGGVLLSPNELLPVALEQLTPADFFDSRLALIFEAMAEMHAAGDPVDRRTVGEYLTRTERIQAAGGKATLDLLN